MTDTDALGHVLNALDPTGASMALVRRNGRLHLALPENGTAAGRTLRLYQPQRQAAKALVVALTLATRIGLHHRLLPRFMTRTEQEILDPPLPDVIAGTCGVMLGSPEHRVRRAIASYQTAHGWEVAKVAFGAAGWEVIRSEVEALRSLPEHTRGAPAVLGVHRGPVLSLLRLPMITGIPLRQSDTADALMLLESWQSDSPPQPMTGFPEWPAMVAALEGSANGRAAIARFATLSLRPVIRHGDFARWNLLRTPDGTLMVLDWEWGVARGMPGLDMVHFFAQDARLVRRLSPQEVIRSVEQSLQTPASLKYLEWNGWGDDVRAVMLASIAFTVGARQQANEDVLATLLRDR